MIVVSHSLVASPTIGMRTLCSSPAHSPVPLHHEGGVGERGKGEKGVGEKNN